HRARAFFPLWRAVPQPRRGVRRRHDRAADLSRAVAEVAGARAHRRERPRDRRGAHGRESAAPAVGCAAVAGRGDGVLPLVGAHAGRGDVRDDARRRRAVVGVALDGARAPRLRRRRRAPPRPLSDDRVQQHARRPPQAGARAPLHGTFARARVRPPPPLRRPDPPRVLVPVPHRHVRRPLPPRLHLAADEDPPRDVHRGGDPMMRLLTLLGTPSIPLLALVADLVLRRRLFSPRERRALLWWSASLSLVLYSSTLGYLPVDVYRAGFSSWAPAVLALVAIAVAPPSLPLALTALDTLVGYPAPTLTRVHVLG